MRYRDCPTVEVSKRIAGDPAEIWRLITDITTPTRFSAELQRVEWLEGDHIRVGARFRGHNTNPAIGEWQTECVVTEVEDGRRWVYDVQGGDGRAAATWGWEIDPGRDAVTLRHWGRMGPGSSGLSHAIASMPEKEGRIVARRLGEWEQNMRANLEGIDALIAG
ncbi:SRPBCC family protein [Skermania sp. ID1734]|uniref:SRPBCC family protein n=1 Tax=Skermania sp. ID1734 TaxID=2597516 RepID=UPI0011804E2B|nr:SRPBCC family protein [Skermania sp. ID1734]TSD93620.1 SRPBCC family protein [Skermania sp. ID1734]